MMDRQRQHACKLPGMVPWPANWRSMMSYFIGPIFVALAVAAFFVEMFWLPQPVNGMFRSTRPVDRMLWPLPPGC